MVVSSDRAGNNSDVLLSFFSPFTSRSKPGQSEASAAPKLISLFPTWQEAQYIQGNALTPAEVLITHITTSDNLFNAAGELGN